MKNIDIIRKFRKECEQNAISTYKKTDDLLQVIVISRDTFEKMLAKYAETAIVRNFDNSVTMVFARHTYERFYVEFKEAGRGRPKRNAREERINEIWNNILNEIGKK